MHKLIDTVREAGQLLRGSDVEVRARWLVDAARQLTDPQGPLGKRARKTLPEATGLSPAMVDWALKTTLDTVTPDSLARVVQDASKHEGATRPIDLLGVVLAGNLFTAATKAMFVPLLVGVPVWVKASSKEDAFARLLEKALTQANPELAAALHVVSFASDDTTRITELFEHIEVISVYGSDTTIATIEQTWGSRVRVLAHGHGLGAAYCSREALGARRRAETISRLALDIAAYDQRGCMSPQVIYVETNGVAQAARFAQMLADQGLQPLAEELPRGPVPTDAGALFLQWRGVVQAHGELIEGPEFAIAIGEGMPSTWSPGYRNVYVRPVTGLDEAVHSLQTFGPHLKCIGVDPDTAPTLDGRVSRQALPCARVCALGTMQTPPFEAPADGLPVWHDLLR